QRRDGINGGNVRGRLQNAYKGHKRGLYEGTGYSGYIRGTADTYGVQRIHTGYSGYIRGTADTDGVQRTAGGHISRRTGSRRVLSAGGRIPGGTSTSRTAYSGTSRKDHV